MSTQSYFDGLAASQRKLRRHGFDRYPTDEELFDYVMQLEGKVAALYSACGMEAVKDCRGVWHAYPFRQEVV